jgi:hypothetical protein
MKTAKHPATRLLWGPAAALALAPAGCGGTDEVSGTVRFNGKPLSKGRVTFVSQENPGASRYSLIAEDGSYKISGCPAGPVKITVQTVVPRSGGAAPGTKPASGRPPAVPTIPARYADAGKSDLEYNVKWGPQTHDIDLQSAGLAPQGKGRR